EAAEERASGSESGLDCIDGDPVKGNHFCTMHQAIPFLSLSLINSEEATTVYSEDAMEEEAHEETEEEAQEDETAIQDKNGRTSVHSSIRQRQHMRRDAMVGLHVLMLMLEPTAVALLYAQQ
ncbi:unnamed protein product, partial [Brassica oleracea]